MGDLCHEITARSHFPHGFFACAGDGAGARGPAEDRQRDSAGVANGSRDRFEGRTPPSFEWGYPPNPPAVGRGSSPRSDRLDRNRFIHYLEVPTAPFRPFVPGRGNHASKGTRSFSIKGVAAPPIISRCGYHTGANGILMDVCNQGGEVAVILDPIGAVATLEKMPLAAVPLVEVLTVSQEKTMHQPRQRISASQ